MNRKLTLVILVFATSVSSYCINCEQLSNVFVLEAHDSSLDSVQGSGGPSPVDSAAKDDSDTRVISDDSATLSPKSSGERTERKQQAEFNKPQQTRVVKAQPSSNSNVNAQHSNNQQKNEGSTNSESRRPDQASTSAKPAKANPPSQSSSNNQVQKQKQASGTPTAEERLLHISIMSDEDDSKPVQREPYLAPNSPSMDGANGNKNPKRITISIQETGKQNGDSPTLIVRPSQDGIEIATLSSTQTGVNSNGNKFKPSSSSQSYPGDTLPSVSSGTSRPSSLLGSGLLGGASRPSLISTLLGGSSNSDQPRPSTSAPVHLPTEDRPTKQPSLGYDETPRPNYSNGGISKPSLNNDGPSRPPYNSERPQRPSYDDDTGSSESTARPSSRPTVSNNDDYIKEPVNSPGGNSGYSSSSQSESSRYPLNEENCGVLRETKIIGGEEANPDDFQWMAALIRSRPTRDGEVKPFCGGSLITRRHVLTAAHCLEGLAPREVLIRLGSYDFDDATASSSSADYAVDLFKVPGNYSKKTHIGDIAIMRLTTPISINDNYKTVCLPKSRRSFVGTLGTVTGYGSQSQSFRQTSPRLRQVTVPVWENRKCSLVYKKNLTESFLCAGYEEGGKDACQGDSGGPLMIQGPNERMMVVGVVSHGIGCGQPGYPGVYTRTSSWMEWIEKNTRERS